MQQLFKSWETKKEFERIIIFHWLFFILVLMSEIIWILYFKKFNFWTIAFIVLFFFSLKALKSLYYSFWTFSSALFLFVGVSTYHSFVIAGAHGPFYFYLLALALFIVELISLHSPIYYPLINWWEYDFRFRSEIKIRVITKLGDEFDGRLTDLRRMAGCVVLFEELKSTDIIKIVTKDKFHEIQINGEVISKRNPLPGRGIQYGVRFLYQGTDEKKSISDFVKYWHRHRKMLSKMRFLNGQDRSV